MAGRQPDYIVTIKARDAKHSARIGAAWKNRAGGINVKIDPGVSISTPDGIDVTLWPPKERDGSGPRDPGPSSSGGGASDDSDIPF